MRRVFKVSVHLELQAVTCPGVWLCPKGTVSLRVCMLGATGSSKELAPVFPLLFHENFIFSKSFGGVRYLTDLQTKLERQSLSVELIQWPEVGPLGTVLACFETTLEELLFPSPEDHEGLQAGVDVDLLMEPTSCFPGILSPKIAVSTRTTIEEMLNSSLCGDSVTSVSVFNHKMISSSKRSTTPCVEQTAGVQNRRQRRVCHGRPPRTCPAQQRLKRRRRAHNTCAVQCKYDCEVKPPCGRASPKLNVTTQPRWRTPSGRASRSCQPAVQSKCRDASLARQPLDPRVTETLLNIYRARAQVVHGNPQPEFPASVTARNHKSAGVPVSFTRQSHKSDRFQVAQPKVPASVTTRSHKSARVPVSVTRQSHKSDTSQVAQVEIPVSFTRLSHKSARVPVSVTTRSHKSNRSQVAHADSQPEFPASITNGSHKSAEVSASVTRQSHKSDSCHVCAGYEQTFDNCPVCCYPIVRTKANPRGCLCESPPSSTASEDQADDEIPSSPEPRGHVSFTSSMSQQQPSHRCADIPCSRISAHRHSMPELKCCSNANGQESTREKFYRSLENFYKKLYEQAKCRPGAGSC